MDFVHFIVEEGLIMIPFLYVIGLIITQTETISNKWIPVILVVISLAVAPALIGEYTPMNMVQAVLITGVTVYSDQLLKIFTRKEEIK